MDENFISSVNELSDLQYGQGKPTELGKWINDVSKFPFITKILKSEDSSDYSKIFSLLYLDSYFRQYFDSHTINEKDQFLSFFLTIGNLHLKLFLSSNPLFSLFLRTFSQLILISWNSSSSVQSIFEELIQPQHQSIDKWFFNISLVSSIAENLQQCEPLHFREIFLNFILQAGFDILRYFFENQNQNFDLIIHQAISCIYWVLQHEVTLSTETRKDDFSQHFYTPHPSLTSISTDINLIQLLFHYIPTLPTDTQILTLKVLILLSYQLLPAFHNSIIKENFIHFFFHK